MLEDIEIFINVVEQMSFSKAARKLKLSSFINRSRRAIL
jgi:DNA-binding transcriptional LysR family regulator